MQEFLDFLQSHNGVAIGVAAVIFIITLWLVVKRLIGFVITLVLLGFALVSGFFVANADLFREILKGFVPSSTPEEKEPLQQLKNQFFKSLTELKGDLQDQKVEFEKVLKQIRHKEKPEQDEAKPVEKKENS